jgi:UDP-N-acetylmuramate dehydrogenase
MMAAAALPSSMIPNPRGRIAFDAPLARFTWFRVGGNADVLFRPADADDLSDFLRDLPTDIPVLPLGVGSNIIVRDSGVEGVVVLLRGPFVEISVEDDVVISGAGALSANVARLAADAGLAGLEFLSGVPGGIGGAVRMNAGAYGGETGDVLVWAEIIGRDGSIRRVTTQGLELAYRHSNLAADDIVVRAAFRGTEDDADDVHARLRDVQARREESQPLRTRTGGSTFRNPPGGKAWQLIDGAGCRGLKVGAAHVSEKHCNFLIAEGGATAADIEALGNLVRERVKASSGVELLWEIKRIGREASS